LVQIKDFFAHKHPKLQSFFTMIFKRLKSGAKVDDADFDAMYTRPVRAISQFHFTPVEVAKMAAQYLVKKPGAKVLDIGSGAGKFCMIGATCTEGHFTGVEQRKSLHLLSQKLAKKHGLANLAFIHKNITTVEFREFDALYFFNAFFENIFHTDPIDGSILMNKQLYAVYSLYVKEQLDNMPVGTRLATYFSYLDEIPDSYEIHRTDFDGKLKLWEKTD